MTPAVSVSRYSLTVDARDTIQAVLDEADATRGAPLREALQWATGRDGAVVAAADVPAFGELTQDGVHPGLPSGRADLPEVSAPTVDDVLRMLERAGFVRVHDLWSDTSSDAYLDEARTLAAVQVEQPFFLAHVTDGSSQPSRAGHADRREIDRREIDRRTGVVGTGWYVVGLVGDVTSALVGVAAVVGDTDPETLTYWAYRVEGFGASSCLAGCGTCGARWRAQRASWHFQADDGDAESTGNARNAESAGNAGSFEFDDAAGFDGDTIACPGCGTGRVGFAVC